MRNSNERSAARDWILGDPGSPNVREYSDREVILIEERMDMLRKAFEQDLWDKAEAQLREEGEL